MHRHNVFIYTGMWPRTVSKPGYRPPGLLRRSRGAASLFQSATCLNVENIKIELVRNTWDLMFQQVWLSKLIPVF